MSVDGNARVDYFVSSLLDSGLWGLVGRRIQYCCGYRGEDDVPHSAFWPHVGYFCPKCGTLWGKEILTRGFDYAPLSNDSWVVETRRCKDCGDGQFLCTKHLDGCDADLLRRELLILIDQQERSLQGEVPCTY